MSLKNLKFTRQHILLQHVIFDVFVSINIATTLCLKKVLTFKLSVTVKS